MTSEVMAGGTRLAYRRCMTSAVADASVTEGGRLLAQWRRRRRLSQLELATRAGVSTRHLSWVETGRSRPSSRLVLRLCGELEVPLREQNRVLVASGHAPAHPERTLDHASMARASEAIEAILDAHLPFPALVVDAGWDLVSANEAVWALVEGLPARLLEPPVNVVRLTLDPAGLAARIVNLVQWRSLLLARVRREHEVAPHDRLAEVLAEFDGHDGARPWEATSPVSAEPELVVPLRLLADPADPSGAVLSFVSTTTVFGTPREVGLAELAIEGFYPADELTRALLAH